MTKLKRPQGTQERVIFDPTSKKKKNGHFSGGPKIHKYWSEYQKSIYFLIGIDVPHRNSEKKIFLKFFNFARKIALKFRLLYISIRSYTLTLEKSENLNPGPGVPMGPTYLGPGMEVGGSDPYLHTQSQPDPAHSGPASRVRIFHVKLYIRTIQRFLEK